MCFAEHIGIVQIEREERRSVSTRAGETGDSRQACTTRTQAAVAAIKGGPQLRAFGLLCGLLAGCIASVYQRTLAASIVPGLRGEG